ncbi:FxSxx-COOH cyclophane-containing RiPP peptide [Streptomyces sp. NPDC005318]|uniref:FxSxx-COOH cyclophane-containing RiPP peptide n=1 Tax=Streptomyces sp. NPDC005318 TaxID=3157031 RepID=UPI002E2D93DA|nr:FxSxx-COOH cyclophane-containing RiPP peptide [Streptomyces sp. NBC_00316]
MTQGSQGGSTGVLPDLLDIDLETLRTVDHPVLKAVIEDLRGRSEGPGEMLWGFQSAL